MDVVQVPKDQVQPMVDFSAATLDFLDAIAGRSQKPKGVGTWSSMTCCYLPVY